jgi:hypothetical protein
MTLGSFSFGPRNARRRRRKSRKISAILHYPAQTKRGQFNNDKEKHFSIIQLRPEAQQYDAIPETTRAGGQRAADEISPFQRYRTFLGQQMHTDRCCTKLMLCFNCKYPQAECDLVLPEVNAVSRRAAPRATSRARGGGVGAASSGTNVKQNNTWRIPPKYQRNLPIND